ncbi:secondary thiamine-phosphate synthase enzyme YjbQ [Thalassotalea agarivorans]|uniref:Secondary thiamine-phosphate synthase enzyme n=1 Tax=Thalassotalea agarivorans TaxID=349064 RepID=A0A1I0I164_THASX|nr:secondary thiamine-phosphate synthase enzyme YjbQ [Thalassotalea agarivorans]SET90347.1 secondary thiamine-phosphate synthase enzyme [Thalassotalea agarivorans]
MWHQQELKLSARSRGFHLITQEIERQLDLSNIAVGVLHLFIKHSSASLTINENADPTVRTDMEAHFNHFVPENARYYQHTYEGPDDMPAHIKASTLGSSVSIPISNGRLNLGTWQGVYLGEHRDYGGSRTLVATINGQSNS